MEIQVETIKIKTKFSEEAFCVKPPHSKRSLGITDVDF